MYILLLNYMNFAEKLKNIEKKCLYYVENNSILQKKYNQNMLNLMVKMRLYVFKLMKT